MKRHQVGAGLVVGMLTLAVAALLVAQPDQPAGQGHQGGGGGRNGQLAKVAAALKAVGLTDQDLALVRTCVQAKIAARMELGKQLKQIGETLKGEGLTDEQAKTALTGYRDSMKSYNDRIATAEKALEDAIHFSKNPKAELALLSLGIIDNGLGFMQRQQGPGQGQGQHPQGPPPGQ